MRVASFFSGIGGFDLGFERAGMQVVFQCEKNAFCRKVLQKNWHEQVENGNLLIKGDINNVKIDEIPQADLWCGGFPCQDVSLANQGKRQGLNGSRSGLFYRFAELLSEQNPRPRWVVLENVPGLLNSNNGDDFRVILRTLDELGYCVSWRILDAKFFGTPQRRRRVYIVGSLGNLSSVKVLFEQIPIAVTNQSCREKEKTITRGLRNSDQKTNVYTIQNAAIGRKPSAGPQGKGYRNDGESFTLDSRGSSDAVYQADVTCRVRETSRISGQLDSARYRSLGNAVAVPVIEWIGRKIISIERNSQ